MFIHIVVRIINKNTYNYTDHTAGRSICKCDLSMLRFYHFVVVYLQSCIYIYMYIYIYVYIYIYIRFCDIQKFWKIRKMTPLFAKIQLVIFLRNRHRLSFEKLISPASPIFCFDKVRVLKFEISQNSGAKSGFSRFAASGIFDFSKLFGRFQYPIIFVGHRGFKNRNDRLQTIKIRKMDPPYDFFGYSNLKIR